MVDSWNREYVTGDWAYLHRPNEDVRYAVLSGLIASPNPESAKLILDLGCGVGILRERLGSSSVERYTGVDWSDEAVELARQGDYERAVFIPASIDEWVPDGRYDAIVFNEVLYYLPQPLVTVARYARFLTDGGSMFVSMWDPAVFISARSPVSKRRLRVRLERSLLWKQLDRRCDVLADVVAKRDRLRTWRIQELRPRSL